MLKLSGRMLSRDHYSGVIIEILGRILSPLTKKQVHIQRSKEGLEPSMSMDLEDDFVDPGNLVTLSEGLVGLTNQVSNIFFLYDNNSNFFFFSRLLLECGESLLKILNYYLCYLLNNGKHFLIFLL